jgi:hypothetical protein
LTRGSLVAWLVSPRPRPPEDTLAETNGRARNLVDRREVEGLVGDVADHAAGFDRSTGSDITERLRHERLEGATENDSRSALNLLLDLRSLRELSRAEPVGSLTGPAFGRV